VPSSPDATGSSLASGLVVEVSAAGGSVAVSVLASVELVEAESPAPPPPQAATNNGIANRITDPRFTPASFDFLVWFRQQGLNVQPAVALSTHVHLVVSIHRPSK
jgi:hypothetical protein